MLRRGIQWRWPPAPPPTHRRLSPDPHRTPRRLAGDHRAGPPSSERSRPPALRLPSPTQADSGHNAAIRVPRLIADHLDGAAAALDGPFTARHLAHAPDSAPLAHDPALARRRLAEAGDPGGLGLADRHPDHHARRGAGTRPAARGSRTPTWSATRGAATSPCSTPRPPAPTASCARSSTAGCGTPGGKDMRTPRSID